MATLKMFLTIDLISDKTAIIKMEYVNLKILVKDGVIFTSNNGFTIEISDNLTLSLNKFIIPENIIGCDDGSCEFRMSFHSDEFRHKYFKELSKILIEFSKSEKITSKIHNTGDVDDDSQIIYLDNSWYLY